MAFHFILFSHLNVNAKRKRTKTKYSSQNCQYSSRLKCSQVNQLWCLHCLLSILLMSIRSMSIRWSSLNRSSCQYNNCQHKLVSNLLSHSLQTDFCHWFSKRSFPSNFAVWHSPSDTPCPGNNFPCMRTTNHISLP